MKVLILFLVLLSPLAAAEPHLKASAIPADATLRVKYASSGCFHSGVNWFEFHDGRVKAWRESEEQENGKQVSKRVLIGELKLAPADVEGLDLLFDYYRTGPEGACTTVDFIEISMIRNDEVIQKEKHVDRSCGVDEVKGVFTFAELARKIGGAAENGETTDE